MLSARGKIRLVFEIRQANENSHVASQLSIPMPLENISKSEKRRQGPGRRTNENNNRMF
jgi:hypothetical protein